MDWVYFIERTMAGFFIGYVAVMLWRIYTLQVEILENDRKARKQEPSPPPSLTLRTYGDD